MPYAIATLVALILDQLLKFWASSNIDAVSGSVKLIPGLISLVQYHNEGVAFGLFSSGMPPFFRWLLVILVLAFAALLIYLIAKNVIHGHFGRWSTVAILSGALGNGIDRAVHGYVVDMIRLDFFKKFPIFNLADIFVTVGAILFCVYVITYKSPEDKLGPPAGDPSGGDMYDCERDEAFTQKRKLPPQPTGIESLSKPDSVELSDRLSATPHHNKAPNALENRLAAARAATQVLPIITATGRSSADFSTPINDVASSLRSAAGRDAAPDNTASDFEAKITSALSARSEKGPLDHSAAPTRDVISETADENFSLDDILAEFLDD